MGEKFFRSAAPQSRCMLVKELLWLDGEEELRISKVQGVCFHKMGEETVGRKRAQKLVLRKASGGTLTKT